MGKIVQRSDRVAFYGIPTGTGETKSETFHRMTGFSSISKSKSPKSYNRQYVDEAFTREDVVGYSESVSYAFDETVGNAVHEDIANIADSELIGDDAARNIVVVYLDQDATESGGKKATMRSYSVIPDAEGDKTDAYTRSGSFKCRGEIIHGTATSEDNWSTLTFTPTS